jgi:signal transduction histidine kinase
MAPRGRSVGTITDVSNLEVARAQLRRLVRSGTAGFALFTLCDLYAGLIPTLHADLAWLLLMRGIGVVWLLAMCLVAELPLEARGIQRCTTVTFVGGASIISAMAIGYQGLVSPYVHGVSLVVLYSATGFSLPWWRALLVAVRIALSFPIVLLLATPFSTLIHDQWHDTRALLEFGQRCMFDLLGTAVVASTTSHLVWTARRQTVLQEEARARLFINLSHDFRTPLGVIRGEAELLEADLDDDAERRASRRIQKNATDLADLCDQLLELARLDVGRAPITKTCFDVVELGRVIAASLEPSSRHARIEVLSSCPLFVEADASHVRRILVNLVGNALRHGSESELLVSLQMRQGVKEGKIEIDVIDNGPGIPEERRERLFERFATFDRQGSTVSGIGLALARELSRLNAGDLEYLPSAQQTTFRLTLPGGVADETQTAELSINDAWDTELAPPIAQPSATTRVLIVEDNDDMAELLRRTLSPHCSISRACGVLAAKQSLAESVPSAVVCDLMLPDGSGYELLQWLRREPGLASVPVLMVSALGDAIERARGLDTGADDYLAKPFSPGELSARVVSLVEKQAEQQRELERQRSDLLMEVHDGVSASLSRALLQLSEDEPTPELQSRAEQAAASIRDGLQEMRAMISLLSARSMSWSELLAELRLQAAQAAEQAGLGLTFDADESFDDLTLSGTMAHDVQRVAREALTNVVRHAHAAQVKCRVSRNDGSLRLVIEDDGCGYPTEARGRGTTIMKRRAERCGGSLRIKRTASGSSVELVVPLRAAESLRTQ